MKISNSLTSFNISASGLSLQRKKMNLIAENIANSNTTKTETGEIYKRKIMKIEKTGGNVVSNPIENTSTLKLKGTNQAHIAPSNTPGSQVAGFQPGLEYDVIDDNSVGDQVYMPDHPDADENGYVTMPNVNVITEMVEMIAASRSYEANLTALNASKQMAKDSLEI